MCYKAKHVFELVERNIDKAIDIFFAYSLISEGFGNSNINKDSWCHDMKQVEMSLKPFASTLKVFLH